MRRVSDELCEHIQHKMLEMEIQVDQMILACSQAGRADAMLTQNLKKLKQYIHGAHRAAGLEMER